MKKLVIVSLMALLVVGLSTAAFAYKSTSKWGKDNGHCAEWVDMYSSPGTVVELGNQPSNYHNGALKGSSPHSILAWFMQFWSCAND